MLNFGARSILNARRGVYYIPASARTVSHYVKHDCEGRGFRKLLGPFWVYTTPVFLTNFAYIGFFFTLLMYPLDSKLYNVRGVKAALDAKIAS
ncbi:putative integral membrane protein [Babesia bovis T2Bo]|uniref:Uncharacterized protein n=1 Tax=Babesia bovis TaxID=5865 RepID=A7AWM5_BABBO|nr:putative integral membrane protein [Babesia bovis T2Bo]EDO05453.1 putative integral membrane protein [Babesia bovis T2Bo]|eukprot:XP_001609021.1 hypothetical protein [Babesia bovis T2Bo]